MQSAVTVTPAALPDVLLHAAVVRPVFLWGAPGIGKSSLVREFAASLGFECVSLLGTRLAPEDLIGIPQIADGRSRFCPPEQIARDEPYFLFLDELNAASPDVQKAFYSLILDRRIGSYELPAGSVVIASYAAARDVPRARVVFCDAAAYDAGYLAVDDIATRVRIRGRGGTVLRPGIDLLQRADDFPADGPILVITDAQCDRVAVRREHAFLVPRGARLPFTPRGPVFRVV